MAKLSPEARKAAEGMSKEQISHYTETNQKGLPEKKADSNQDEFYKDLHDNIGDRDSFKKWRDKITSGHYSGSRPAAHYKKANILTPEIADILHNIFNAPSGTGIAEGLLKNLGKGRFGVPTEVSPVPTNMHYQQPGFVTMDSPFRTMKTAKESYVEGFIKKSFEAGLDKEATLILMEKAGFAPFLIPLATSLLGGFGAEALGARLAARSLAARTAQKATLAPVRNAMAGALKANPEIGKGFNISNNLGITPKINTWQDRGNQLLNAAGDFHGKRNWVAPIIGSMVVPAAVDPFIPGGEAQPSQAGQPPQDPSQQGYMQ